MVQCAWCAAVTGRGHFGLAKTSLLWTSKSSRKRRRWRSWQHPGRTRYFFDLRGPALRWTCQELTGDCCAVGNASGGRGLPCICVGPPSAGHPRSSRNRRQLRSWQRPARATCRLDLRRRAFRWSFRNSRKWRQLRSCPTPLGSAMYSMVPRIMAVVTVRRWPCS